MALFATCKLFLLHGRQLWQNPLNSDGVRAFVCLKSISPKGKLDTKKILFYAFDLFVNHTREKRYFHR